MSGHRGVGASWGGEPVVCGVVWSVIDILKEAVIFGARMLEKL